MSKQSQPYDLEFRPKQRRRHKQLLGFLGGFFAVVLLLGAASLIALWRDDTAERDGSLWDQFIGALRPTQEATEPPEGTWAHTGNALFLLCETDDAQQNLRFCALVRADITNRLLHVFPLQPQSIVPDEQSGRTLEQALREGGPKELAAAVERLAESKIDRWISSTDKAFVQMVNLLGSVKVQVDEGINYNVPESDFQLILGKGSNTPLSGDQLLRYFRYLGTLEEEGTAAQGALLARVLETYIVKAMDEKQLETAFNTMMNAVQTDITVSDFYTRMGMLLDILAGGGEFAVDVKE